MSQSDRRSTLRRDDVSIADVESHSTPEATYEAGNADLSAALLDGPQDAFHGLIAGATSLAAHGIDVTPVMTSLALRRRAMLHADVAAGAATTVDVATSRSGSALPDSIRTRMEASFQHQFGHVRIHTDAAAAKAAKDLNAHAFAMGSHIYFGEGTYRPGSSDTDRLLAHELTHVVQHDEGRIHGSGVSSPTDALEREAYANESQIMARMASPQQASQDDASWMDASLALGPVPHAVESARDGGGSAQQAASAELSAQAASMGAGAYGLGGVAMRAETEEGAPETGPKKFEVGDEVIAKSGERGRRGVVAEVREWKEGDGPTQTAPEDGWTYVVRFERSDGTTEGPFVAENMRKAEPQDVPNASMPEEKAEETVDDAVCEPEEEVASTEDSTLSESADVSGPEVSGGEQTSTSPVTDSTELPAFGPVMGPSLPTTSPVQFGTVGNMSFPTNIPEAPELNQTHQRVVQSLNTRLGEGQETFNTAASEIESLCLDSSSAFGTSETTLRQSFMTTNTSNLQSMGTDVDGVFTETDSAFTSFEQTVEQSASELSTNLTTQAQTTEQSLLQSQADFPLVIQRAVEAQRVLMEAEFGSVITDITNQANEEKAAAERASRTYGGGPARADEIAGDLQKSKVKENYAKALRKFLDAVFEDLMAKGGMPAEQWSQSLHAPALADVWPGMERHQTLVDQKKNRDQVRANEAKTRWQGVVSNERATVSEQTASHQDQVCEQQDEATEQLNMSVEQVVTQNEQTTQIVASGLEERQEEEQEALNEVAPDESTGVDTSMWDLYVAKYEYRSNAEHQRTLQAVQAYNEDGIAGVEDLFNATTLSMENHAQQEQQSVELQHSVFRQGVQQSASEQVQGLQTQATGIQAQHVETAQQAQTQATELLTGIGGAAQTFLAETVQPALDGYTTSTRQNMGQLLGKMEDALKGAGAAGAAAEKKDRESRASNVWAAADYTWGTDEAKMMKAVSGTSPVQAHALCVTYEAQHPHDLQYIIEDETSGSLKRALLAWIFGDEVAAAKHTMDYGSSSWFPDADVMDSSLRGISDEGRKTLNTDPEWNAKSQDDSLNAWYREGDTENALASLADMSLTKDQAELQADSALLFQSMDTITGTDEAGAYALLEKYGPEKSAELRAAYAEYSYDRQYGDGSFDALSADRQQQLTNSTLTNDIEGDFSGYDEDRALAASQGNMGANRAAQLAQSANWSNDEQAALAAVSDDNMYKGDDWLTGVNATQDHAVFMQTMAQYQNGEEVTLDDIQTSNTTEGKQTALNNWQANQDSTQEFIGDEFWGLNTAENMLRDKLLTGEADEGDMLMFGADTLGTREKWVTDALNQVKAQTDYYTRLDMLVNLGGRAAEYARTTLPPGPLRNYQNQAAAQMGRLPSYLTSLDPAKASALTGAIRHILICLNAEADGGQQFDWELLLGESLRRDKNATDMWQMADQKFKNMLPESARNRAANHADLQAWLNESQASRESDLKERRERWQNGEEESWDGQVVDTELALAAHIIKLKRMYDAGSGVHFDTSTGFLFAQSNADQSSATETWWSEFEAQCARVDTANQFEEANQNKVAAMATMIVTAIAGVAIAIVSLGSATAVSAALWSAGITLAAGLVNIAINFAIKGARYGAEDILSDLANTLVDAALQFATLGLSKMAKIGPFLKMAADSGTAFQKVIAAAITSVPGELKGLLFNEDVWRGDNLDSALRQFFVGVAKGTTTGVVADYAKDKFKPITDANGLAGQYLEGAIDEITGIAGDALTNPQALQDPAYWINMTTKLGLGTLGGHVAQRRAVELMNGLDFGELNTEHLGRLHPGVLAELSYDHRMQIKTRADQGIEVYVDLNNALKTAGNEADPDAPPEQDLPANEQVNNNNNDDDPPVDEEEIPQLNQSLLTEEEDDGLDSTGPHHEDEDSELNQSLVDGEEEDTALDPNASLTRVEGSGDDTGTTSTRTVADIDDEVLDMLDRYGAGGSSAQLMTEYVMQLDTPEQRLYAINTLEQAFHIQSSTHVSEMSPADMEMVCRSHILHDRAFQNAETMRKVVPEGSMQGLWTDRDGNPQRQPGMGGSVAASGNTDGLTAPEMVSVLGLDYQWIDDDGNRHLSPYVTEVDGHYQPVNEVLYVDSPVTEQMRESAKIPVHPDIIAFAKDHPDPMLQWLAENRYVEAPDHHEAPIDGQQVSRNPRTGNGMTMPTSWLGNPTIVPNQEYTMGYTGVAPGTQWYGLDAQGNRIVVLTYNGPASMAHAPYTLSNSIPPNSQLEAQVNRILMRAEESTGQDPLRPYDR